jgi:hypothetical protein
MNPQRQSFEAFALPMFHAFSTWGRDRDRSRVRLKQKQKKERKQGKEYKKEHRCSFFLPLVTTSQKIGAFLLRSPKRHRPGSRRLGGSWESCKVQAANQGDNATLLRMAEHKLNQVTSTAQEFRGASRKPGIRVNRGENQMLTLLASFVYQKIVRMFVSRCGQQEGLYQRLLKMPQPVGGRTIKHGGKLVHPTGTSISKYRRNQVFHIADSRQGMGANDPFPLKLWRVTSPTLLLLYGSPQNAFVLCEMWGQSQVHSDPISKLSD